MKKQLKAFTLTELLIGMIISSLVIGFGYGSYSIIYKQYLSFRKIKKELVSTVQLDAIISADFVRAERIRFTDNRLMLQLPANAGVEYEFRDSSILRSCNEVVDTFKQAPLNIISKTALQTAEEPTALITELSYDAKILGETEHFIFKKQYSAATLMNDALSLKEE